MENVDEWYSSKLKNDILDIDKDYHVKEADRFVEFKTRCGGKVIAKSSRNDLVQYRVYFEREEDLVMYLLTFDDLQPESDIAGYYCPYIPLTNSGVIIDPTTMQPVAGNITNVPIKIYVDNQQ